MRLGAESTQGGGVSRPVIVRRAVADDAMAIAELQDIANEGQLSHGAWHRADRDWRDVGAEQIAGGRTEMAIAATVVATLAGEVVGMLNFAANDAPPDVSDEVGRPFVALRRALGPCLYLRAMAVRADQRGRGIASQLLDVAAGAARHADASAIGVIVHEKNGTLLDHYKRRGFTEVAREPILRHVAYAPGSMLVALRAPVAGDA